MSLHFPLLPLLILSPWKSLHDPEISGMPSSSFGFSFSLIFYAFFFFTTLSVLVSSKVPFLAAFSTLQALQVISFDTISLTSIRMPAFPKFIFSAGTSPLKLQLPITYVTHPSTKWLLGDISSICLKLNSFFFPSPQNTWILFLYFLS